MTIFKPQLPEVTNNLVKYADIVKQIGELAHQAHQIFDQCNTQEKEFVGGFLLTFNTGLLKPPGVFIAIGNQTNIVGIVTQAKSYVDQSTRTISDE